MHPPLKYGLIAALALSAWTFGEYALGLHTVRVALANYTSWGALLIMIVVLWRLLHHQVHQPQRLWLPVWEGLLYGILTGVVAAAGFYVFFSAYLYFINPDYPYVMLEWKIAQLRAANTPEADIRELARRFLWSMGTVGLPVTLVGLHLLIAVVVSPILTLWLNWRNQGPVRTG